jgi:hypothetical protein
VEDDILISNIDEYIKLADNDNLEDNNRVKNEELSSSVIFEIIQNYPERKSWLVHNKHIPIEILKLLSKDEDIDVRFTIAMKKKCNRSIFEVLMNDSDFSVRMAIVRNNKLPIDLLEKMLNDSEPEISDEAMNMLKKRNHVKL